MIGEGEVVSLADYATDHFKKYNGRPLRVAVDEAGWRFNNLTDFQVEEIRKKEPAANPIEKTVLWRILSLMKLNIQLMFVFDGPKRPWKRGRRGGLKIDWDKIRLLQQLLDHLKIPRHQAPGEAEAECAKMQALGIVDAVWSDDSDTFMFGATCKIEAHKENGKRVQGKVRIHRSETILQQHGLNKESLILFALLAGGDYNQKGLQGCGPQTTKLVANVKHDLAGSLFRCTKHEVPRWRMLLETVFREYGKRMSIPDSFPDLKVMNNYRNPTVSTDDQLRNLRGSRNGWDCPIDQMKLRVLLRQRFNFETREYMKHMAPIFLVKELARCNSQEARLSNMRFDIQLKRVRAKKPQPGEDAEPTPAETKITFYPLPAIEIDISSEPADEDWSKWEKGGSHYSPSERVETELLACFLERGLVEMPTLPEPASKTKKKAVKDANANEGGDSTDQAMPADTVTAAQEPAGSATSAAPRPQKKRGRPKKDNCQEGEKAPSKKRKKKTAEPDKSPPSAAPTGFRLPRGVSAAVLNKPPGNVVDLCMDDSSGEGSAPKAGPSRSAELQNTASRGSSPLAFSSPEKSPGRLADAVSLGLQSSIPSNVNTSSSEHVAQPGLPLSPATLRARRLVSFAERSSNAVSAAASAITKRSDASPRDLDVEVVDLT